MVTTCTKPEVTNQHRPFSHALTMCNMRSAIRKFHVLVLGILFVEYEAYIIMMC